MPRPNCRTCACYHRGTPDAMCLHTREVLPTDQRELRQRHQTCIRQDGSGYVERHPADNRRVLLLLLNRCLPVIMETRPTTCDGLPSTPALELQKLEDLYGFTLTNRERQVVLTRYERGTR